MGEVPSSINKLRQDIPEEIDGVLLLFVLTVTEDEYRRDVGGGKRSLERVDDHGPVKRISQVCFNNLERA